MKFVDIDEFPALIRAIRSYPKRDKAIGLELFVLLFPRPVGAISIAQKSLIILMVLVTKIQHKFSSTRIT